MSLSGRSICRRKPVTGQFLYAFAAEMAPDSNCRPKPLDPEPGFIVGLA
jgi:hypothetical protein